VGAGNAAVAKRILSTLSTAQYLGASPELSVRLLAKMKDPKSSADDIAGLMGCSPTMCASLLKLCNSAFYSRGNVIDSVPRAIVHLGLDTVVRFVYAMEMMGVFSGAPETRPFNETTFWKSSLAGAYLAQNLAERMSADEEAVFLGGLLRDIGVCVVRQYFPDLFEASWAIAERRQCSFDEACAEACGLDHRAIAFLLAMRWKLPAAVLAVFQPPARQHPEYARMALIRSIVAYSDHLLKTRKVFLWDEHVRGDNGAAQSLFVAADIVDAAVARIVSDVNGLHEALA
jgi:HD-like signal output (HDOD) protein